LRNLVTKKQKNQGVSSSGGRCYNILDKIRKIVVKNIQQRGYDAKTQTGLSNQKTLK
jgi:hypothetical protein